MRDLNQPFFVCLDQTGVFFQKYRDRFRGNRSQLAEGVIRSRQRFIAIGPLADRKLQCDGLAKSWVRWRKNRRLRTGSPLAVDQYLL